MHITARITFIHKFNLVEIQTQISFYKIKTHSLKWTNSPRETEPDWKKKKKKKKEWKVLPSDNNSPNRTEYPRKTEPGEKKGKVLPSDNNSPYSTDYPGETESGESGDETGRK